MIERNITEGAALLLDCIATFSCNEVCTYQDFIVYAIMTNLLKLSRPELKEKILDGPEVLSVASDIPVVVRRQKLHREVSMDARSSSNSP